MNEPLVSVVIPVYNAERFVDRAIHSILNQTYTNFELILVDDGSEDSSLPVIGKIGDERIKLLVNNHNDGIAVATNKGISVSKGKYIALLDDDDEAVENRLELQVRYLEEHSDIDVLGGRTIYIDEDDSIIGFQGETRRNPKLMKALLLFRCVDFSNGTAMIRKQFMIDNKLEYQDECYGMQDYKFFIDCSKCGNITTIDRYLLKHRKHENNGTKYYTTKFASIRAEVYARFQRDSLKESGYVLCDRDLKIINKALAEDKGHCDSVGELCLLYDVFKEILIQGKHMNIAYYDELEYICKKELSRQLLQMNIF